MVPVLNFRLDVLFFLVSNSCVRRRFQPRNGTVDLGLRI